MRVEDSIFFKEALRFIGYGVSLNWHERNAGNISLRLLDWEIESVKDSFSYDNEWVELDENITDMSGELVFTTVSGSYFIDMNHNSPEKFCICEISSCGGKYRVLWGGRKPTSELCGHLMSLGALKKRGAYRAVYHCHPANVVALSYVLPQNEKDFSRAIWESETEGPFVFPGGIGIVDFKIPGSMELAKATAEKVETFDAVLWSFHGLFATGESIASAFGLAHAIEKAAEIKLKVLSTGMPILNRITVDQQKKTAKYYGYELNEFN